eukprot:TRINITY_DN18325_c0_g1_i3.p2 TRINITY_DN18325_c0_g1~~TRINITY_DN18325_c0_g1_i3.p2  ORF type:complete len:378 (+),score=91.87 TRINITY_DN18325_c0_g1_i3:146-1135(+)
MAHFAWNCESERPTMAKPKDMAEERLLMKRVMPSTLPKPWTGDALELRHDEYDEFESILKTELATDKRSILLACDGGSKEKAATWAVAHESGWTASAVIHSEDSTPLKAELCAAESLTKAIAAVVTKQAAGEDWTGVQFDISIDCKPAMALIRRKQLPLERWRHVSSIQEAVAQIKRAGAEVQWHWTPSHGKKKPSFKPTIDGTALRRVNDWADTAATKKLQEVLGEKGHVAWRKAHAAADEWSIGASLFTAKQAETHVKAIPETRTVVENMEEVAIPEHELADELARLADEARAAELAELLAENQAAQAMAVDPMADEEFSFWPCTMD